MSKGTRGTKEFALSISRFTHNEVVRKEDPRDVVIASRFFALRLLN